MRGFAVVLATLCASAASEEVLSLLQTSSVKVHVAEQSEETGKKECKASKQAFKELKTTLKADRRALKEARDALKAAKLKRKATRDAMKEAKANMEKDCEVDPDDLAEDEIRPCVAQKADDIEFPRYRVQPQDAAKHYSLGRAAEPDPVWGGRLKSVEHGGADMAMTYDLQKAFGVPTDARVPLEDCAKGCPPIVRSSQSLGQNVPSPDYCLKTALGSPDCVGMKSITFKFSGYQGGGDCWCTGATKRAKCPPRSPAATDGHLPCDGMYDNYENAAWKTQFSVTCMLPKRAPTDHSTYYPGGHWQQSKINVCNGHASSERAGVIQDHSDKSILIGKFGADTRGRAACADESWKNKKCKEIATRLSVSKDGECRCEWGPLLISDQQYRWSLNGFKYGDHSQLLASGNYQQKWSTCLYPRALLKQGAPGEAFAMRIWAR